MDEEEIQTQVTKFPRLGNGAGTGRADSSKIAHKLADQNYPDDELGTQLKRVGVGTGNRLTDNGTTDRLRGWHHSRIIRVSRTTGGKDRHSKVLTSKGLRDRRVRLSVATAIQFYDIQDRLGYDQPSKAVEWLIRAASDSIAELPSLNGTFAESPKQLSDEKRGSEGTEPGGGGEGGGGGGFESAEVGIDIDADPGNYHLQPNQHVSLSKSACSSTSETSKGSGLSLSRSEIRVNREKARERARERTAKEKDKEPTHQQTSLNPSIAQNPSFTELLTSGIGGSAVGGNNNNNSSSNNNNNNNNNATSSTSPSGSNHHRGEGGLFQKMAAPARWVSAPMEYFGTCFSGNSLSRAPPHHSSGFPGIHMGVATNSLPLQVPPFSISGDGANHQELQAFSFVPDPHLIPTAAATTTSSQAGVSGGEYDLNFTISSSVLGGYNRGTLQSNSSSSPSLWPHHIQRFSSIDGSSVPFFIGTATPVVENHHHNHHVSQFPTGLQLCYGDGTRHSDQKGKTKN